MARRRRLSQGKTYDTDQWPCRFFFGANVTGRSHDRFTSDYTHPNDTRFWRRLGLTLTTAPDACASAQSKLVVYEDRGRSNRMWRGDQEDSRRGQSNSHNNNTRCDAGAGGGNDTHRRGDDDHGSYGSGGSSDNARWGEDDARINRDSGGRGDIGGDSS